MKKAEIYNAQWWFAVDHDGTPWLHCRKPRQIDGKQYVCEEGSHCLYPNEVPDSLKNITFEDGPVRVRLDMTVTRFVRA